MFAKRLRERRLKLKLTQRQLAEAMGLQHSTISTCEKGLRQPPLDKFLELAERLGCSPTWLFGLDDELTPAAAPAWFRPCMEQLSRVTAARDRNALQAMIAALSRE
jgi:transcriptional regulator with XRE-family HTH domain